MHLLSARPCGRLRLAIIDGARCGPAGGARHVSHRRRHRRNVHRLCAVRCARRQDVGAQAADHAARPLRGGDRGHRGAAGARQRRHRRRQRRRARHDARHQRGDRAPRRRHRHAGDGGLQRHPRYGLRAPLRPVRPARQVSRRRWCRAGCASRWRSACASTAASSCRSTKPRCRAAAQRFQRARRRRRRRLLPAFLRQPGARAARRADPARGGARTCSSPPRPTSSRTCASSSAGRRRPSTPSRSRCSTATSSGWRTGLADAGLPRPPLHHVLERRHADRRHGAALPGARARVRARPPAP